MEWVKPAATVALGAAFGANLRYFVSDWLARHQGNPRNSTRTECIIRLGTHFRERRVCARSSNPLNSGLGPTKNSMAR